MLCSCLCSPPPPRPPGKGFSKGDNTRGAKRNLNKAYSIKSISYLYLVVCPSPFCLSVNRYLKLPSIPDSFRFCSSPSLLFMTNLFINCKRSPLLSLSTPVLCKTLGKPSWIPSYITDGRSRSCISICVKSHVSRARWEHCSFPKRCRWVASSWVWTLQNERKWTDKHLLWLNLGNLCSPLQL